MKYLKQFESQTDFEYKQITRREYVDNYYLNKNREILIFNTKTISQIKNAVNNKYSIIFDGVRIEILFPNKYLKLESYSDNWYILIDIDPNTEAKYYLCDDIEGLVKLCNLLTNQSY